MKVKIKANDTFSFLPECKDRFIVMRGSAGSGKSYALAQFIVFSLLTNYNLKWLALRKVAITLKESVYALLNDVIIDMGVRSKFKINKTDKSFECISTMSSIIMVGLDDVEKLKSIHGIDKIWMEEASEDTEADFKQINLRLRGKGKNHQIYLSFNPIDENHWIKKYSMI